MPERFAQTRFIIRCEEHDNSMCVAKSYVQDIADVWRGPSGASDSFRPLQRMKADRPQKLEHGLTRCCISTMYHEHFSSPFGGPWWLRRFVHRRGLVAGRPCDVLDRDFIALISKDDGRKAESMIQGQGSVSRRGRTRELIALEDSVVLLILMRSISQRGWMCQRRLLVDLWRMDEQTDLVGLAR